jgi:hypothetical protein
MSIGTGPSGVDRVGTVNFIALYADTPGWTAAGKIRRSRQWKWELNINLPSSHPSICWPAPRGNSDRTWSDGEPNTRPRLIIVSGLGLEWELIIGLGKS